MQLFWGPEGLALAAGERGSEHLVPAGVGYLCLYCYVSMARSARLELGRVGG
jgi:hypothetical protein